MFEFQPLIFQGVLLQSSYWASISFPHSLEVGTSSMPDTFTNLHPWKPNMTSKKSSCSVGNRSSFMVDCPVFNVFFFVGAISCGNTWQYQASRVDKINQQNIYQLEKTSPQQKTPRPHTQHTQAYIKLHTSIYTSIHTSNTYKHIHKTKQKQNTQTTAEAHPQTAPQKTEQKKSITLYNSKYCIR